jgi:hypothetical protein
VGVLPVQNMIVFSPLFFKVSLALTSTLYLASGFVYFFRRKKFAIAQRSPSLVLLSLFINSVIGISALICGIVDLQTFVDNCHTIFYLGTALVDFALVVFTFRLLYFFGKQVPPNLLRKCVRALPEMLSLKFKPTKMDPNSSRRLTRGSCGCWKITKTASLG